MDTSTRRGAQGTVLCPRFLPWPERRHRLHHHVQHVHKFLGLGAAAQAKDTGSQQPVAQKNVAALDPVDSRDVLKVDNLDMLAAESTILEHLDTVRLDLDVFKHARTFVLEQQSVVVHARHLHRAR